jgi:hypothetical protein
MAIPCAIPATVNHLSERESPSAHRGCRARSSLPLDRSKLRDEDRKRGSQPANKSLINRLRRSVPGLARLQPTSQPRRRSDRSASTLDREHKRLLIPAAASAHAPIGHASITMAAQSVGCVVLCVVCPSSRPKAMMERLMAVGRSGGALGGISHGWAGEHVGQVRVTGSTSSFFILQDPNVGLPCTKPAHDRFMLRETLC